MEENKLYEQTQEQKLLDQQRREQEMDWAALEANPRMRSSGFDLDIWNSLTPEKQAALEEYIRQAEMYDQEI